MICPKCFIASVTLIALCWGQNASGIKIQIVKNTPFSADITSEDSKVLADGSAVTKKATATIARDSEGRTRREQSLPDGSSIVFIQDPTAGFAYEIHSNTKSVRRFPISVDDNKVTASVPSNSESLGSQMLEGVQVDGTQITRKIAIGAAGNDRPLELSIETWYSNELQTTVMKKTTDPRDGQRFFKLINIQRSEPDANLFKIPAGYSISDWVTEGSGRPAAK